MITKLKMETGSEGPSYDPYGFEEYTLIRGDRKFVLHEGLGCWVEVDGVRKMAQMDEDGFYETDNWRRWERLTGLTVKQTKRAYHRIHGPFNKCQKCGSKKLVEKSGYPGESYDICEGCGSFVNSYFDESAII